MKIILTIIILCSGILINAQGIKAEFLVNSLPDNAWFLKLHKDNSYKYIVWSGFSGSHTLDSGRYKLVDEQITFTSEMLKSTDSYDKKVFYLKRKLINRNQEVSGHMIYRKKTLYGTRIISLKINSGDSLTIKSTKPTDNIKSVNIAPDNNLSEWLTKNIFIGKYQYSKSEWEKEFRTEIFQSSKLEVKAIHNSFDMFGIYFYSDGNVYYTNYQRKIKYQFAVTKAMKMKGLISRREMNQINKEIKQIFKNKEI